MPRLTEVGLTVPLSVRTLREYVLEMVLPLYAAVRVQDIAWETVGVPEKAPVLVLNETPVGRAPV